MATAEDLDETVRIIQSRGRRAVSAKAEVRRPDGVVGAVAEGVARLGRLAHPHELDCEVGLDSDCKTLLGR